jgi:hypothetical protein
LGVIIKDLLDKHFSKKNTAAYDLSILIEMDRLSYAIRNEDFGLLLLHDYSFKEDRARLSLRNCLQKKLQNDPLLNTPYHSVRIAFDAPGFTLVPVRLFDPNNKAAYLSSAMSLHAKDVPMADIVPNMGLANVFTSPADTLRLLQEHFPSATVMHALTPLVLHIAKRLEGDEQGKRMFLNMTSSESCHLMLFDRAQLVYANAFTFKTANDLLYYALMVFSSFKLSPDVEPLYLLGHILPESEGYKALYKYIRNVNFLPRTSPTPSGLPMDETLEHQYLGLFSLSTY